MWLLPRRAFLRNAPFSVSLGALDAAFSVLVEALRLRRRLRAMEKTAFLSIFQRLDINILNFREHFPAPDFAYSAHSFA